MFDEEMISWIFVIKKVYINMDHILNGYRVMGVLLLS